MNFRKLFIATSLVLASTSLSAYAADNSDQSVSAELAKLKGRLEKLEVSGKGSSSMQNVNIYGVVDSKATWYNNPNTSTNGFASRGSKQGLSLDNSIVGIKADLDDNVQVRIEAAVLSGQQENSASGSDSFKIYQAYARVKDVFGFAAKIGRFTPHVGVYNNQHQSMDEFADRPLPYKSLLNGRVIDDGAQVSYKIDMNGHNLRVGGAALRGNDLYGNFEGASHDGVGVYNAFAEFNTELGDAGKISLNSSLLSGTTDTSPTDDINNTSKQTLYTFGGKYELDNLSVSGEYFKDQKDSTANTVNASTNNNGWYAQASYKIAKEYRVSYRYAALEDANGYAPVEQSVAADYMLNNKSYVRLQYTSSDAISTSGAQQDHEDRVYLQFVTGFGDCK